jgi:hypothetical protein
VRQVQIARLLAQVRDAMSGGDPTNALELAIRAIRLQHPGAGEMAVFGYIDRARAQYFAENPDSPFAPAVGAAITPFGASAAAEAAAARAAEAAIRDAAARASGTAVEQFTEILARQGRLHERSRLGAARVAGAAPPPLPPAPTGGAETVEESTGWLSTLLRTLSLGVMGSQPSQAQQMQDDAAAAAAAADSAAAAAAIASAEDSAPLLELQGLGAVLDSLAASPDSSVCPYCNGLFARARMQAHLTHWCEASPHYVPYEDDSDGDG